MSVDPVIAVPVLVAVGAGALALAGLRLWRGAAIGDVARTTALVALLVAVGFDPATGGAEVEVAATSADVLFVIDTTGSSAAEDYDGSATRLSGMKADIRAIADEFPGSRLAVVSFDSGARLELPWTTDRGALDAALDVVDREQTLYSQGSRLDAGQELALEQLQRGAARNLERDEKRAQYVVFLSDGELTEGEGWNPFVAVGDAADGGAVLGYGTAEGGRMLYNYGWDSTSDQFLYDYAEGGDALSRIDEDNLVAIAGELGVEYWHRSAPGDIDEIIESMQNEPLTVAAGDERLGARHWYWVLAIGAAGLAAWQLWSTTAAAVDGARIARRTT